jgi:hypothetical protein
LEQQADDTTSITCFKNFDILKEKKTMSDISILSRRYEAVSKLSDKLNDAVLILKKKALKANEPESGMLRARDWSETDEAREVLRNFLDEALKIIDGQITSEAIIPYSLVDRFQKLNETMPHFIQELRELYRRMAKYQDLTPKDFDLFDELLSVVDSNVEAVFSKLWRKR